MEFVLIGGEKLKITLSPEEVERLDIDLREPDYTDVETKRLLLELLELGKLKTGFAPRGAKLFVEIHLNEEGGCVFTFTALSIQAGKPGSPAGVKPVIFAFEEADSLCEGAAGLQRRYSHRIYKSSLYRFREQYRLIVYPLDYADQLSLYFLGEYGRKTGEGAVAAAFIDEHGAALILDTAIETLADYFA